MPPRISCQEILKCCLLLLLLHARSDSGRGLHGAVKLTTAVHIGLCIFYLTLN